LLAGSKVALEQLITDEAYAAAILQALRARKYRRPVTPKPGPTSRTGWESRAVAYGEWLAKRDQVELPAGAAKVIWDVVTARGRREQRIRAVKFGELQIELPSWDWVAPEPVFVDLTLREAA
jgi:hypothetical protein